MTDEQAFFAAMDANPEDRLTLLVFADWLAERGDPREMGYRELANLGIVPSKVVMDGPGQEVRYILGRKENIGDMIVNFGGGDVRKATASLLTKDWHDEMRCLEHKNPIRNSWKYHDSPSRSFDEAAIAFAKWKKIIRADSPRTAAREPDRRRSRRATGARPPIRGS